VKKNRIRIMIIACVAVLVVLCIPTRFAYKDGGSFGYAAFLYRVTYYHAMPPEETDENGDVWYFTERERVKAEPGEEWELGGTEVQILGIPVYNDVGLRKISETSE
jgi:hypothetical protein